MVLVLELFSEEAEKLIDEQFGMILISNDMEKYIQY